MYKSITNYTDNLDKSWKIGMEIMKSWKFWNQIEKLDRCHNPEKLEDIWKFETNIPVFESVLYPIHKYK